MATEQKSYELEPLTGLTPHEKNYIKAVAKEAAKTNDTAPVAQTCKCGAYAAQIAELQEQLDKLAERFAEDDKYSLTRAKILRLMKAEGIE